MEEDGVRHYEGEVGGTGVTQGGGSPVNNQWSLPQQRSPGG